MAYKITTDVYDNVGNTYTTDVYCEYDAPTDKEMLADGKVLFLLSYWKTQADKEAGFAMLIAVDNLTDRLPIVSFIHQFASVEEADNFNKIAADAVCLAWLKGIFGDANVIEL